MTQVVGAPDATLAVASAAHAFVAAGLGRLSGRRPLLVVTPTAAAAEQLAHDIAVFMGAEGPGQADWAGGFADGSAGGRSGEGRAGGGRPGGPREAAARAGAKGADLDGPVELFPAWETLPFERVSPDVATMGRRLRLLWRLGTEGATPPEVVVAPVKALLQRLGPWRSAARPVVVTKGERLVVDELVARLVALGYRREEIVEHRGELAVRGGIVDVFPSTADAPVRIDLWGDEVDRLTAFDVDDQRSAADLPVAEIFGCRELVLDEEMRARAAALVGEEPWGRHQWERLAEGLVFDGMESWLPWLVPHEELLVDLLADDSLVVMAEPRRVRDRAAELIDEEATLADALAATWGADTGKPPPRLHLPFERLLASTRAHVVSLVPPGDLAASRGADGTATIESRGWEPI
ncbi:MAG TPA: hypothetical protein VKW77_03055, partial [Acidimicrobiales bacterium]|nr:hypothetical protein [Acidimicrobiales bacterium]